MSLATYADLKAAIGSWLGHSLFANNYDDFVTLFEARACRDLHIRENTTTATITMSGGSGSLPADFIGAKRVTWTGTPNVDLQYIHPPYMTALYPTSATGTPIHYTVEGGTIKVRPSNDTSLEMLYVQKTAAVSSSLNWLFTKHPDTYLFGSLVEAEAFGSNDERMPMWKARVDEAFAEILRQDFNNRGKMSVRVAGPTP